jgi:hypothetical protein
MSLTLSQFSCVPSDNRGHVVVVIAVVVVVVYVAVVVVVGVFVAVVPDGRLLKKNIAQLASYLSKKEQN